MSATAPETVPHQYPFRLVERLESREGRCVAVALASSNGALMRVSPWPLALVAEALAQSILLVAPPPEGEDLRLVALSSVRLHQAVGPGDRLEVEVEEVGAYPPLRRYSCRALRGGALAAEGEFTVAG